MRAVMCVVVGLLLVGTAYAELQNVQVGGIIEIRSRWYHNAFTDSNNPTVIKPVPVARIAPGLMHGRATGQAGNGVLSLFRYDDADNDWAFVEQQTSLNFSADFTDNVKGFIEFYDFRVWGEGFRSDYITGQDFRENGDDIQLLQGYIEADKIYGQPLRLRIGRQVIQFGRDLNVFMMGGRFTPTQRISHDGIRATYQPIDKLTIDAFWTKLDENSPVEEDGDVDFYGLYVNYALSEAINISPFFFYVRDARRVADTNGDSWITNQFEHFFGLDDYDVTNLYVPGVEFSGKYAGFDYSYRVAYEFGEAGQLGSRFVLPWGGIGPYGDQEAEYDNWGMDGQIGYTFDIPWKVRPYILGAYYEGEDNRDVSFWDWLNPFHRAKASVSFNRLFSDINYAPVINDNGDMTNFFMAQIGVTMSPTDSLSWTVRGYNVWADKTFEWPAYISVPKTTWWIPTGRLLIWPQLSFWDQESDNNLGFTIDTILKYAYSKDLSIILYYGHLFTGEGLRDGQYLNFNGTMFNGGLNDADADYVFVWWILRF